MGANDFYVMTSDGWKTGTQVMAGAIAPARVIADNASSQSIASGAPFTAITNWTEIVDTAAAFDPVTGLFTAPAAGYYLITCGIVTNTVPQANNFFLGIVVNGTAQIQSNTPTPATGGSVGNGGFQIHGVVRLALADVLKVTVTQFSGGAITLFSGATDNHLEIDQLIGGAP
jgi:hypothetical protein